MARFEVSQLSQWEQTRPWNQTRDDAEHERVPGFGYSQTRGTEVASFERNQIKLKDDFFDYPENVRRAIAYHEAGHAIMESLGGLSALDGITSYDPFDLLDLPGAQLLGYNAEEVIAEGYSVLMTEPQWLHQYPEIERAIVKVVREAGFPLSTTGKVNIEKGSRNPQRPVLHDPEIPHTGTMVSESGTLEDWWDRSGDEPVWAQPYDELLSDALYEWKGSNSSLGIWMNHVLTDPSYHATNGTAKIWKAQATALIEEVRNGAPAPRLYRGDSKEPTGIRGWSANIETAQRFADMGGGDIWVLDGARGIEIERYAPGSGLNSHEEEWIVEVQPGEAKIEQSRRTASRQVVYDEVVDGNRFTISGGMWGGDMTFDLFVHDGPEVEGGMSYDIGSLVLKTDPDGFYYVHDIRVDGAYRREGWGTRLFEAAERVHGPIGHSDPIDMTPAGLEWSKSVGRVPQPGEESGSTYNPLFASLDKTAAGKPVYEMTESEFRSIEPRIMYHVTSNEQDYQTLLREGVRMSNVPMTRARRTFMNGEQTTFAPGNGAGMGLYASPLWWQVTGYGRYAVAIEVSPGEYEIPPEHSWDEHYTMDFALRDADGVLITQDIPASRVHAMFPGMFKFIPNDPYDAATDERNHVTSSLDVASDGTSSRPGVTAYGAVGEWDVPPDDDYYDGPISGTYNPSQPVYLRFGRWDEMTEQSRNHIDGTLEYGVSVYDLDGTSPLMHYIYETEEYDPDDPDSFYEEPRDPWTDLLNRIGEWRDGAWFVQGDVVGVGYDGEALLKNVRAVGEVMRRGDIGPPKDFPRRASLTAGVGTSESPEGDLKTVELQDVRKGDWFKTDRMKRMGWPYVQATGDAIHDPDHPSDTSAGWDEFEDMFEPLRMFIVPYGRGFTPHEDAESEVEIVRTRTASLTCTASAGAWYHEVEQDYRAEFGVGTSNMRALESMLRRVLGQAGVPQAEEAYIIEYPSMSSTSAIGFDFGTNPPIGFVALGSRMVDTLTLLHEAAHLIERHQSGRWSQKATSVADAHNMVWAGIFHDLLSNWAGPAAANYMAKGWNERMGFNAFASKTAFQFPGITLFHGTVGYYADKILSEGLSPRTETGVTNHWNGDAESWEGRVYFSLSNRLTISQRAFEEARKNVYQMKYGAEEARIEEAYNESKADIYEELTGRRPHKYGASYTFDFYRGDDEAKDAFYERIKGLRSKYDLQREVEHTDPDLQPALLKVTLTPDMWENLTFDEDVRMSAVPTTEQLAERGQSFPEWMGSLGADSVVAYKGSVPSSKIERVNGLPRGWNVPGMLPDSHRRASLTAGLNGSMNGWVFYNSAEDSLNFVDSQTSVQPPFIKGGWSAVDGAMFRFEGNDIWVTQGNGSSGISSNAWHPMAIRGLERLADEYPEVGRMTLHVTQPVNGYGEWVDNPNGKGRRQLPNPTGWAEVGDTYSVWQWLSGVNHLRAGASKKEAWTAYPNTETMTLYRGLHFGEEFMTYVLGDGSFDRANQSALLRDAFRGQSSAGWHWTTDMDIAYNFALDNDLEGWANNTPGYEKVLWGVVVQAEVPRSSILRHPDDEDDYDGFGGDVFGYDHIEREVPLKEGANFHVTYAAIVARDEDGGHHEHVIDSGLVPHTAAAFPHDEYARCTNAVYQAITGDVCPYEIRDGQLLLGELSNAGWTWGIEYDFPKTVRALMGDPTYQTGTYYVITAGHAMALIDGKLIDTEGRGADGRHVVGVYPLRRKSTLASAAAFTPSKTAASGNAYRGFNVPLHDTATVVRLLGDLAEGRTDSTIKAVLDTIASGQRESWWEQSPYADGVGAGTWWSRAIHDAESYSTLPNGFGIPVMFTARTDDAWEPHAGVNGQPHWYRLPTGMSVDIAGASATLPSPETAAHLLMMIERAGLKLTSFQAADWNDEHDGIEVPLPTGGLPKTASMWPFYAEEEKVVQVKRGAIVLAWNGSTEFRASTKSGSDPIGVLIVERFADPPYPAEIEVARNFQRNGIGTALWEYAKEKFPNLVHSTTQSEDGKAWAGVTATLSSVAAFRPPAPAFRPPAPAFRP